MNSYDIIKRPIITEKSMQVLTDREGNEIRRYTF